MPAHTTPTSPGLRAVRLAILALLAVALVFVAPAGAEEIPPDPTSTDAATEVATEGPTGEPAGDPATEQLQVAAILCLDWSCFEFGDRLDSFTISAVDLDTGATLDTCVTDAGSGFGGCVLEVPFGARWTLAFDEAQTPDGFVYHGSIIGVEGGAHGSVTYLPFHPLVDEEPGHMVVQAALCTDATCDEFADLLDGFTIRAVNPETGQEYGQCVTGNAQQGLDHQCIVDVPAKGLVELRWNDDEVPDGYEPFGEPITSGEPAVTTIAFVPLEDDDVPPATEAPVTGLPVTGTAGPASSPPDGVAGIAAVVLTVLLLGISAWHDLRRR